MGWTPGDRNRGSLLPLKCLSHQAGLPAGKWAGEGLQIGGPLLVQGGPFFPSCSCTLAQALDTWCLQGGPAAPTFSATEICAFGFSTGGARGYHRDCLRPLRVPRPPPPPLHPRQGAEVSNCWEDDGGLAVHLGPAGKLKSFTVARGPDQRSAPVGGAGGLLVLGRG